MKKINHLLMLTAVLALLSTASCKKTDPLSTEDGLQKMAARGGTDINHVDDEASEGLPGFFASRGPKAQVFIFSTEQMPIELKTDKGTSIVIPKDAFLVDGEPAKGTVTFKVKEFTNRGDILTGGTNTMADGGLLETDGSFNLDATVDGKKVDDALAKPLAFQVPDGNNVDNTGLFAGVVQNDPNAKAPFNWVAPPAGAPRNVAASSGSFSFNWPSMGWVNCDRLMTFSNLTTLTVDLPNNPGTLASFQGYSGNTFVLFVPKGLNTVVHVYTHTTDAQVVSYANSIPVGMTGKLLGFSLVNGDWWYDEKEITVTANMVESLTFNKSDENTVAANLSVLSSY